MCPAIEQPFLSSHQRHVQVIHLGGERGGREEIMHDSDLALAQLQDATRTCTERSSITPLRCAGRPLWLPSNSHHPGVPRCPLPPPPVLRGGCWGWGLQTAPGWTATILEEASSSAEPQTKQDFTSTPAIAISYAKRINSSAGLIKCLKHNSGIKGGSYRLTFSHQVTLKIPIQLN